MFLMHTLAMLKPVLEKEKGIKKSVLIEKITKAMEVAVEKDLGLEGNIHVLIDAEKQKFAVHVITEFLFEHELTVYLCVFDRTSYEFSRVVFDEISELINDEYVEVQEAAQNPEIEQYAKRFIDNREVRYKCESFSAPIVCSDSAPVESESSGNKTLAEYMKSMDKSFALKLFDYIDAKGMTDVECYKKANVDKKTFSKIKCNPDTYKPSKQTAVAFAIALELTLDETQDLLASAGLTLSRSFAFDKIIRYFIQKGNYNIFEINEALFEFDQMLLGC